MHSSLTTRPNCHEHENIGTQTNNCPIFLLHFPILFSLFLTNEFAIYRLQTSLAGSLSSTVYGPTCRASSSVNPRRPPTTPYIPHHIYRAKELITLPPPSLLRIVIFDALPFFSLNSIFLLTQTTALPSNPIIMHSLA